MADIKARAKVQSWFTIPARLVDDCGGYTRVCFVELTANDEMAATKRCHGEPMRLAWELARESLRYADKGEGPETISTSDASVDIFWNAVGSRCRQMLMAAFGQVHAAKPEDAADFLGSLEVRVG